MDNKINRTSKTNYQSNKRRGYLTIGWTVSALWLLALILPDSEMLKMDYPLLSSFITLAVIVFVCNEVFSWRNKAQILNSKLEAKRLEEWERMVDEKERKNRQ